MIKRHQLNRLLDRNIATRTCEAQQIRQKMSQAVEIMLTTSSKTSRLKKTLKRINKQKDFFSKDRKKELIRMKKMRKRGSLSSHSDKRVILLESKAFLAEECAQNQHHTKIIESSTMVSSSPFTFCFLFLSLSFYFSFISLSLYCISTLSLSLSLSSSSSSL